jgi:hypothetical protein
MLGHHIVLLLLVDMVAEGREGWSELKMGIGGAGSLG